MTRYIDQNFTADGSSPTAKWVGGEGYFNLFGSSFGGGTGTLEYSFDQGTTWVPMGVDTTVTSNGGGEFSQAPCDIRVTLSGSTSPVLQAIVTKIRFD